MAKLVWDKVGERLYETGTSNGVLFLSGEASKGVAWNGLVSVKQSPDGAEDTPMYANNIKYLSMTSAENFKGTIEAFTYPVEFQAAEGSKEIAPGVYAGQQNREPFDLAYSTLIGNDLKGTDFGEKIHLIYNAKVAPTERAYETVNNDPNALTFSWAFTTTPAVPEVVDVRPTAYVAVSSVDTDPGKFQALKDMIHGTESEEPKMPTIDELVTLMNTGSVG